MRENVLTAFCQLPTAASPSSLLWSYAVASKLAPYNCLPDVVAKCEGRQTTVRKP